MKSSSMRSKSGTSVEKFPGPGTYEYKSNIVVREKGHDFGKEERDKNAANRVPGPGSYEF